MLEALPDLRVAASSTRNPATPPFPVKKPPATSTRTNPAMGQSPSHRDLVRIVDPVYTTTPDGPGRRRGGR